MKLEALGQTICQWAPIAKAAPSDPIAKAVTSGPIAKAAPTGPIAKAAPSDPIAKAVLSGPIAKAAPSDSIVPFQCALHQCHARQPRHARQPHLLRHPPQGDSGSGRLCRPLSGCPKLALLVCVPEELEDVEECWPKASDEAGRTASAPASGRGLVAPAGWGDGLLLAAILCDAGLVGSRRGSRGMQTEMLPPLLARAGLNECAADHPGINVVVARS